MLLNAVLLAVVIYTGAQLRKQWKASKAREKAIPVGVKTLPTPRYQPLEPPPPVIPTSYNDIAQKLLFDRSRDPKVIIEPPPPPPPPPPMPPLPVYHGMMNIGDEGPIAILSLGTASNQAIHPGEKIGQFKLLAVNSEEIDFEWNGATIRKSVGELTGAARGIAPVQQYGDGLRTEAPVAAAPPRPILVG